MPSGQSEGSSSSFAIPIPQVGLGSHQVHENEAALSPARATGDPGSFFRKLRRLWKTQMLLSD